MQTKNDLPVIQAAMRISRTLLYSILLLLYASPPSLAETASETAFADIEESVVSLLQSELGSYDRNIEVSVQPPRMIPEGCSGFTASLGGQSVSSSGRVVARIRCEGGSARQFYVHAQVRIIGSYLASSSDIPAGAAITRDMVQLVNGDITSMLRDIVENEAGLSNNVLRRSLRAGQAILKTNLEEPILINRGQNVTFETVGSAFRISGTGTAMQSGVAGEHIDLKLPSNKIISGTVTGPGRISIY